MVVRVRVKVGENEGGKYTQRQGEQSEKMEGEVREGNRKKEWRRRKWLLVEKDKMEGVK